MKHIKAFLIVFIISVGVVKAQFTTAELQVSGLNCALCSKTTIRSLSALSFVSEVKPDLMHNIYVLTFKSETPVNFDEIGKIVHEEGFFVSSLKASVDFGSVKVDDNKFTYHGDLYEVVNKADKTLAGQMSVLLVDKGFAPKSVSKKYLGQVAISAAPSNGKIYHVAI